MLKRTGLLTSRFWTMLIISSLNIQPGMIDRLVYARAPEAGLKVSGHGLTGTIEQVQEVQPLAAHGIWRVSLTGERVGRLVRLNVGTEPNWALLQLDDMTDEELDTLEEALSESPSTPGR